MKPQLLMRQRKDPVSNPTRYTIVQTVYDLSGNVGLFKDVVKAGSYLYVTDRRGKFMFIPSP